MDGGDCSRNHSSSEFQLQPEQLPATDTKANQSFRYLFNKTERIPRMVAEHNTKVMRLNKLRRKRTPKNITEGHDERSLVFDSYAASLQHTNRVLNLRYGFKVRYAAAHSPILIDSDIMQDLQDTFRKEFAKTSKNRVRHDDDMQYALSYYYYLMSERSNVTLDEMFDLFDTDKSG